MNKIKRLPTLEEARVKSYRELFYQVKNLQSVDSVFQLAPPQVMLNPEAMNYPVFEFTLDEIEDAYLSELEGKLEEIRIAVAFAKAMPDTSFACHAVQNITKKYF